MASKWLVPLFCYGVISVFCAVESDNVVNSYAPHAGKIEAVLSYLNAAPYKLYNYKSATLLSARTKTAITELSLDVVVDCINRYPDVPCNEKTLICNAFVQQDQEGFRVLNDVKCQPKPEIIIEETPQPTDVAVEVNESKSVVLSNEAVSSEVGEQFVAVPRNHDLCLGCPIDLNPEVEGVNDLVQIALGHIETERPNKQALIKVIRLQQQIVSGVKFILTAEIASTVCNKDVQEPCPVDGQVPSQTCEITYLQKPWINKAKHIISNNCTVSQEFVLEDNKMNNEVGSGASVSPSTNGPNFNQIAESGVIDEMTLARLRDLESQIITDVEPENEPMRIALETPQAPASMESTEYAPLTSQQEMVLNEFVSTFYSPTNTTGEDELPNISEEDNNLTEIASTENIPHDKKRDLLEADLFPKIKRAANSSEESAESVESNVTVSNNQLQANSSEESSEEVTPKEKRDLLQLELFPREKRGANSSEESVESPESNVTLSENRRLTNNSSEESSEEAATTVRPELEAATEVPRLKRAVPHLEKIAPEEKQLVKNLADFAARALDDIDDDNHRRVILQILGAKKMVADDGIYYRLIMRMGVSKCLEDKVSQEDCRERLFENYTKICKVQVHVDKDLSNPKVVKSQCQNIKRDHDKNRTNYGRFKRGLAGGKISIDEDSEEVQNRAAEAVSYLKSVPKYKEARLLDVVSARRGLVNGYLYEIEKKLALGDKLLRCTAHIWEKSWNNFKNIAIHCEGDDKTYSFDAGKQKHSKSQHYNYKKDYYSYNLRKKRDLTGNRTNYGRFKRAMGIFEISIDKDSEEVQNRAAEAVSYLKSVPKYKEARLLDVVSARKLFVVGGYYYIIEKNLAWGDKQLTCNATIGERSNLKNIYIRCEGDDEKYSFDAGKQNPSESQHYNSSCNLRKKRDLTGNDSDELTLRQFANFLEKFNKHYEGEEFTRRLKIFRNNLKYIRMLNAYERGTAVYGITRFTDVNRKEFSKSLGLRPALRNANAPPFAQAEIPDVTLPDAFDWRTKGVVTEVKNQQQCGSCWAFSVTGNVEGQYAIKNKKLMEFSEQELVDCDTEDQGCNGGLMDTAYRVIEKLGGLETEQDYPYDAKDEKCHFNKTLARVQLSGAVNISQDETQMAKWLVANGPISIAINANAMQFYMGGVSHPFKFLCNPKSLDHGVLIVGYGVYRNSYFNKTTPYWIVKNSWGPRWGEQGYYRVYRGDGTCGVNQTPSSAIVA